jgi:hypothetical protein
MSIGDYDPFNDPLAKGRTLVGGGGVNSNSNAYFYKSENLYCNPNGKITYSDSTSENISPIVGVSSNEIINTQYVYAPYVPLHQTVSIDFEIFDDSSSGGKIHKLSESIKKLKEKL